MPDPTPPQRRKAPPTAGARAHRGRAASGPLSPGDRLGRYTLGQVIGRGGFGVVYAAHDPDLSRPVALKLPSPGVLFDAAERELFLAEARTAAQLDHPNIVPVFEIGEAGPLCFIASALCEGPDLSRWLAHRGLPFEPRLAAALVAGVAEGVQYAHGRGLVHCDLKPANVLLVPLPGSGTRSQTLAAVLNPGDAPGVAPGGLLLPRVTDFGLARWATPRPGGDGPGGARGPAGTPEYMAPEAFEPGRPPTFAADVYALGAILLELLTGQPPAVDPQTGRPDPRVTLGASAADGVPADLRAVCRACLHPDPGRRYPSAAGLAADLHRYLDGATLPPPPPPAPARPGPRRTAALVSLAALTAALALTVAAGVLPPADPPPAAVRTQARLDDRTFAWLNEVLRPPPEDAAVASASRLYGAGDAEGAYRALDGSGGLTPRPYLAARLLRARLDRSHATVVLPAQSARAAVAVPGGYALAGRDGWLRLASPGSEASPTPVRRAAGEVLALAATPDGRAVVAGLVDGSVEVFGQSRAARLRAGARPVVAVSADGATIRAADDSGAVYQWDTNGAPGPVTPPPEGAAAPLSAALAGDRLALGGGGDALPGLTGGAAVARPGERVRRVALSPDGLTLAWGTSDGRVGVRRLPAGPSRYLASHEGGVEALALAPDGRFLVSGHDTGRLVIWDAGPLAWRQTLPGHARAVQSLAFRADGRELLSAGVGGRARAWAFPEALPDLDPEDAPADWLGGAFLPNGAFAAWSAAGAVRLWAACTREGGPARRVGGPPVLFGTLSADGNDVLTLHADGVRARPLDPAAPWPADAPPDVPAALGPDARAAALPGGRLVVADRAGVRLFDLALRTVRAAPAPAEPHAVAAVPGGVLVADRAGGVSFWDIEPPRRRDGWPTVEPVTGPVAASPDGKCLATVEGLAVRVYDTATRECAATLDGHSRPPTHLAFAPDGRELLTVAADHTLRVWGVGSGICLLKLPWRGTGTPALAVAPDGRAVALVVEESHGRARVWMDVCP